MRPDGTYDERIGPYAGRFVKDADPDLDRGPARARPAAARRDATSTPTRTAGAAARRCSTTPSRPGTSRTTALRDRLLAANETVDWHPEHIKHGRFGDWLREQRRLGAVARALLGHAAAGVALRSDGEHDARASARFAELEELVGRARSRTRTGPSSTRSASRARTAASAMQRVPEVIDVWFDSGSMPFAQYHAPFENEERFEARFPADFICEAIDQTRGWFYSLLAISTLLFDRSPYETVVCLGLILDADGQKMSKSQGQHRRALGRHRPLRRRRLPLVLLHLQAAVGRLPLLARRRSASRCASSCSSCGTRTRSSSSTRTPTTRRAPTGEPTDLDRWIAVAAERDGRDGHRAPRRLRRDDAPAARSPTFVDDLSNWYVRRSRRRFWDGDRAAFATLRDVPA